MRFATKKKVLYALAFVGTAGLLLGLWGVWRTMGYRDSLLKYEMEIAGDARILFFRDTQLPYITFDLLFLEGGADFSPRPGVSALTGNLLDQGAGDLNSEEIQSQLNFHGTGLSIGLGRQSCSLSLSGLSRHGTVLWGLFKKIIAQPHLSPKELEMLKKQYIVSRLEKFNNPSAMAMEVWRRTLFPHHPFGAPRSGVITSLKKISLEEVKTFYKERYRESAPVFTVVGQYNTALKKDILSFFKEHFNTGKTTAGSVVEKSETSPAGGRPSAEQPPPFYKTTAVPKPFKEPGKPILLTHEDLVQSELTAGYTLPPYPSSDPKKATALKLANHVFGGSSLNSRLMLTLREKMGLAYDINSGFSFNKRYGLFVLSGATKTASTGKFLKELLTLLRDFREKGITEKELSSAKSSLKGRFLRQMETMEDRANMFVYYHFQLGLKKSYLDDYVKLIDSISLEDTRQVIEEYVFPEKLQTLIYGHPSVADLWEGLSLPAPQVIPFKEYFKEELP